MIFEKNKVVRINNFLTINSDKMIADTLSLIAAKKSKNNLENKYKN